MKQNMDDLKELEELKTTYNLLEQRLGGQEIVSDKQLREVMERRLININRYLKTTLIALNLIATPLFALFLYLVRDLTVENIIGLILMWTVSLVFGILFYRKTSRAYYADWDITTICNQDAKYQKLLKWYNIVTCMFWMAYTTLKSLFTVHDMAEFIVWLIIMALLAGASFVGLKLGKAINRRMPTDPETGLRQSPKWLNAAIIIITLALAVFYVITKR